jgi:hypothetical protein
LRSPWMSAIAFRSSAGIGSTLAAA